MKLKKNRNCDVDALVRTFKESNKNDEKLMISRKTVGILTSLTCKCKVGCECNTPHEEVIWPGKGRKTASKNYGLNVRYVLAMQQVGSCGTEADIVMSFLNLQGGATMKSRTFHNLEENIGEIIRQLSEQAIQDALEERIFAQLKQDNRESYFEKWKKGERLAHLKITVCFDMGWNKRSSGNRYDSNSGHAFIIGGITKKLLACACFQKHVALANTIKSKTILRNISTQKIIRLHPRV